MAISTGDILRLVVSMIWADGNIMQNVYAAQITGAGGPWPDGDVLDDLEDWADQMYAEILTQISSFVDGNEVFGYVWDPVGLDWDLFGSEPWSWLPTNAGSELPRGVAAFMKAPTSDPDVQGRKYIGGATEGELVTGLWSAGFVAQLVLYGADWILPFIGTLTTATITPGVWSVKNSSFHNFDTEVNISTIPAYQRRRKRGVGI